MSTTRASNTLAWAEDCARRQNLQTVGYGALLINRGKGVRISGHVTRISDDDQFRANGQIGNLLDIIEMLNGRVDEGQISNLKITAHIAYDPTPKGAGKP